MKTKYSDQMVIGDFTVDSGESDVKIDCFPDLAPGDAILLKRVSLNLALNSPDLTAESGE